MSLMGFITIYDEVKLILFEHNGPELNTWNEFARRFYILIKFTECYKFIIIVCDDW